MKKAIFLLTLFVITITNIHVYGQEGLQRYLNDDNKWGYQDIVTGVEVLPCKYDFAGTFTGGVAGVKIDGKCGFIDKTGAEVLPLQYTGFSNSLYDGVFVVIIKNRWTVIDKTGGVLLDIAKENRSINPYVHLIWYIRVTEYKGIPVLGIYYKLNGVNMLYTIDINGKDVKDIDKNKAKGAYEQKLAQIEQAKKQVATQIEQANQQTSVLIEKNKPARKIYKVGNIYDENGIKGIVVKVSADGQEGVVMSAEVTIAPWCKNEKLYYTTTAFDEKNGEKNMETITQYINSGKATWDDFPAFKWVKSLGEGWYIPAVDELQEAFVNLNGETMVVNHKKISQIEAFIMDYWGKNVNEVFLWGDDARRYICSILSSTESPVGHSYVMGSYKEEDDNLTLRTDPDIKSTVRYFRPFHKFSTSGTAPVRQTTAVQVVQLANAQAGDIVEINGVKAIVFQNDGNGHGKAMALEALRNVDKPYDRATQWCKSLGSGWYIPSAPELEDFTKFWMGMNTELNWNNNTQTQSTQDDGRRKTFGQNEHSKKINQKIAEAGGIPFSTYVYSSTEKAGKITVLDISFNIKDVNMTWDMEEIAKNKLGLKNIGRAFIEY